MKTNMIELPNDLTRSIRIFARGWAESDQRPYPDEGTTLHWQKLISNWAHTPDLPLFIRKGRADRGQAKIHHSGRLLVPVDNSTAQWAYTLALAGEKPSITDIRGFIENDKIPIAMIFSKAIKMEAIYKCVLTPDFNLNKKGWKLAHLNEVGINKRTPLQELPIEVLMEHFYKFLSPKNMFLIPIQHAGIAEDPIMVKEMKKFQNKMLRDDPSEVL